ncbi:hypothetical protein SAMN05192561_10969 [Halopenitus malekzadehii]|uniref:PGF-CTERM protein n=1 Tax=Halopenitus malekzadehii TaxID=1267564 RepID=A0A1H6JCT9_9EURY|nr:BGTF surface domain-containing protein [Halopenitus malekzadehii]SEH58544.1 hypothetical protein SAMN05192561_10969 [Halopenitus malekzadehii]
MTRDTYVPPILLAALCCAVVCAVVCAVAIAPAAAAASPSAVSPSATAPSAATTVETATATPESATTATATPDPASTDGNATITVGSAGDANSTAQVAEPDAEAVGGWSEATYEDPAGDIVTLTLDLSAAAGAEGADGDAATSAGADAPDHAYIQIGSAAVGFVDVLYLADANDDGEVTVSVNTRTLGTSDSVSATNTDLVYHAPEDEVRSAVHGRLPSGSDAPAPTFVGPDGEELSGFDAYLETLGLIGSADTDRGIDQLDRPLQPGTYPVAAGTEGTFRVLEAGSTTPGTSAPGTSAMVGGGDGGDGAGDADDGAEDAAGEDDAGGDGADAGDDPATLGRATIELTRPGIGDVSVHAAPAAPANAAANHTELEASLSDRGTVAAGDRLVIAAEATGIYGHLVAIEGDFESLSGRFDANSLLTLETRRGEGVRFALEALDGPVVQGPGSTPGVDSPSELLVLSAADPEAVSVYADEAGGELYVVIDTRAVDEVRPTSGDTRRFRASLAYETDAAEPFLFDRADRHIQRFDRGLVGGAGGDPDRPAFPYLEPGTNASARSTVAVARPYARFTVDDDTGGTGGTGSNGDAGGDDGDAGDRDEAGGTLRLPNAGAVRIAGETNLAPGTEAQLRVASGETSALSYVLLSTVRVRADGTFAERFDLSRASVGDTATVTVATERHGTLARANATIVGTAGEADPVSEPTDLPSFTDTPDEPIAESTPGFGVGVALLALGAVLLGAAGLRRRRS